MREQREDQERASVRRAEREAEMDALVDLTMKAWRALLEGKAALVIGEGHDVGSRIVYFQQPTT